MATAPGGNEIDKSRKRKHSSGGSPLSPNTQPRNTRGQLTINYLAREYAHNLPLITKDDPLSFILQLIVEYDGVLDRQESLASNLGAQSLGPMLLKTLAKMLDGPPRVLKSSGKGATAITWLDVIDFARTKPSQFQLQQMSEGQRVCQFHHKGCRVQISEEAFVLIQNGIPQKIIPPQPIASDEEKELGTLEILEENVDKIRTMADQVAELARKFNHKLLARKRAIIERRTSEMMERRASETSVNSYGLVRDLSPSNVARPNGGKPPPSPGGFRPVNSTESSNTLEGVRQYEATVNPAAVSPEVHNELLESFKRRPQDGREANLGHMRSLSGVTAATSPGEFSSPFPVQPEQMFDRRPSQPVPISPRPPLVPCGGLGSPRAGGHEGQFKTEMVARMEVLQKGERIFPPCDRCRRLHMDCLKNLTACAGCTKKHAKCSWSKVTLEEIQGTDHYFSDEPRAMGQRIPQRGRALNKEEDVRMADVDSGRHLPYHEYHPLQQPQQGYGNPEAADQAHQQAAHSLAMAAMNRTIEAEAVGGDMLATAANSNAPDTVSSEPGAASLAAAHTYGPPPPAQYSQLGQQARAESSSTSRGSANPTPV